MSLWQAFLVVGMLAILLASLGSTIESSLEVMNKEQLSQLESLKWKNWKHQGVRFSIKNISAENALKLSLH